MQVDFHRNFPSFLDLLKRWNSAGGGTSTNEDLQKSISTFEQALLISTSTHCLTVAVSHGKSYTSSGYFLPSTVCLANISKLSCLCLCLCLCHHCGLSTTTSMVELILKFFGSQSKSFVRESESHLETVRGNSGLSVIGIITIFIS